ncbi:MAG TPA: PaaI family thioesterase [Thermoleophilaceae bacterium]|nr:PaaI family thioesterase [Thermoleophilaceae bacterium]
MDRSMIVSWEDPGELGEQARAMRGLDFLEAIRDEELPPAPIQRLLDFTLTEVEEGRVVFTAEPGEQHYNPIGVVHGGLAATLLDSAMGAAVHSTLPEGQGYTTLETKFNLVRAITADTGPIEAEGRVVHRGRQVATAEGHLRDGAGKLLAHGTSTCLIVGG